MIIKKIWDQLLDLFYEAYYGEKRHWLKIETPYPVTWRKVKDAKKKK